MVFISYSHDSDSFCDKILDFSNELRSNGIDAIIDQYEDAPAEGWPRWMESQICNAEYVLVVCTNEYNDKATLKTHVTSGLGVKWESNIILNQLYATGAVTNKFIPVIFNENDKDAILAPLKGQTFYNVSFDRQKETLKNRLLGIKNNIKPPLGTIASMPLRKAKPDARLLITGVIDYETWNKANWKGVGYLSDLSHPPCLGLMHENTDAAIKIFSDWKRRFGNVDKNDEIYISIIEQNDNPAYFVHIGADIIGVKKRLKSTGVDLNDEYKYFVQLDRWHKMEIVDKKYLELFKQEYYRHKIYYLIPMQNVSGEIIPLFDFSIRKTKIRFVKTSELEEGDYDHIALTFDQEH
jgi:hypothetical protein